MFQEEEEEIPAEDNNAEAEAVNPDGVHLEEPAAWNLEQAQVVENQPAQHDQGTRS